ncbi:MAG: hypothetical protein IT459_17075 [Planctomycetes bacterium]|nr:hypothetical protein [Planctomycetota bacterium]
MASSSTPKPDEPDRDKLRRAVDFISNTLARSRGEIGLVAILRSDADPSIDDDWWLHRKSVLWNLLFKAQAKCPGISGYLRTAIPDAVQFETRVSVLLERLLGDGGRTFRSGAVTDEEAQILTSLAEELLAVERVLNSARRALAAAPPVEGASPIEHAKDFSWLVVRGHRYAFPRPQQVHVMQLLYTEWEKSGRQDGSGLRESTLGKELETAADAFRIVKLFEKHEALGRILRRPAKGVWALYLNDEGPDAG